MKKSWLEPNLTTEQRAQCFVDETIAALESDPGRYGDVDKWIDKIRQSKRAIAIKDVFRLKDKHAFLELVRDEDTAKLIADKLFDDEDERRKTGWDMRDVELELMARDLDAVRRIWREHSVRRYRDDGLPEGEKIVVDLYKKLFPEGTEPRKLVSALKNYMTRRNRKPRYRSKKRPPS